MLKQLDMFKIHSYLMISKTDKKSGRKKYTTSYGSYAGFVITVIIVILAFAYLLDSLLKIKSSEYDVMISEHSANTFENTKDAFITERDKNFLIPLLSFHLFDDKLNDFDIYIDN